MTAARKLDRPSWIEVEQDEQVVYCMCRRCNRPITFYRAYLERQPDALSEAISAHARCKA